MRTHPRSVRVRTRARTAHACACALRVSARVSAASRACVRARARASPCRACAYACASASAGAVAGRVRGRRGRHVSARRGRAQQKGARNACASRERAAGIGAVSPLLSKRGSDLNTRRAYFGKIMQLFRDLPLAMLKWHLNNPHTSYMLERRCLGEVLMCVCRGGGQRKGKAEAQRKSTGKGQFVREMGRLGVLTVQRPRRAQQKCRGSGHLLWASQSAWGEARRAMQ
eukprot:6203620-Pleurochrysis_carterae.AAC.1